MNLKTYLREMNKLTNTKLVKKGLSKPKTSF